MYPANTTRLGGIPRSEQLQAVSVARLSVSEVFPQGAVPPASAPLWWEGVWDRCRVLGVLWKKVRGCLRVWAGLQRFAGGWGRAARGVRWGTGEGGQGESGGEGGARCGEMQPPEGVSERCASVNASECVRAGAGRAPRGARVSVCSRAPPSGPPAQPGGPSFLPHSPLPGGPGAGTPRRSRRRRRVGEPWARRCRRGPSRADPARPGCADPASRRATPCQTLLLRPPRPRAEQRGEREGGAPGRARPGAGGAGLG